nr:glycosyl hydrolase family 8 [Fredinandcohnia onubensis]
MKVQVKGVRTVAVLLVIVLVVCVVLLFWNNKSPSTTQAFVEEWFINPNGTIATYVLPDEEFDTDLAKGREALSESLGLWMQYAIVADDRKLFEKAYQSLVAYFMEDDGFIYWKLNELGTSEVYTNALVDDLRIMEALFQAQKKWGGDYGTTAVKIGEFWNTQPQVGFLTDYYDSQYAYSGISLSLSYIDPVAIESMWERGLLDAETAQRTIGILREAPIKGGFYPKSYVARGYRFAEEVHMVDQALAAYHQVKLGIVSKEFLEFVKKEMSEAGVVYGRYKLENGQPTVEYESPSVYGFLLMYSMEIGEKELAEKIYRRMIAFRNDDKDSPYYGGYSVDKSGNTHVFDNLVPMLAEQVYVGR